VGFRIVFHPAFIRIGRIPPRPVFLLIFSPFPARLSPISVFFIARRSKRLRFFAKTI